MTAKIHPYKLDTAFAELLDFDPLAMPGDFIEVSLWRDGKGFDVHLSRDGDETIRLTWGEFKAIKKLIKELGK